MSARSPRSPLLAAACAALLLPASGLAAPDGPPEARLLRFPDVRGDTVVFVQAGDLWRAPVSGGPAHRLTSHPGLELFPKISPDGKWVAFSGEYTGTRQVWVVPAWGGTPPPFFSSSRTRAAHSPGHAGAGRHPALAAISPCAS